MANTAIMNILQANLGRGRIATNEVLQRAQGMESSILLIQEPHVDKNVVVGFGRYSNCVLTGNREDESPWACVVVRDKKYTAVLLRHLSTAYCVCVHITGPYESFFVVSQH